MFDEPSSFLDVKQRLNAARTIRDLLRPDDYVICRNSEYQFLMVLLTIYQVLSTICLS